jgi:hypothetical protein
MRVNTSIEFRCTQRFAESGDFFLRPLQVHGIAAVAPHLQSRFLNEQHYHAAGVEDTVISSSHEGFIHNTHDMLRYLNWKP